MDIRYSALREASGTYVEYSTEFRVNIFIEDIKLTLEQRVNMVSVKLQRWLVLRGAVASNPTKPCLRVIRK